MIFIAHRGNINGKIPEKENHPDYINAALQEGYDVEIDVWLVGSKLLLGHDGPTYEVDESFLKNEHFWHHAKNMESMHYLNNAKPNYLINCFYHQTDDCVLTSGGWIWTYPGKPILSDTAVAVLPERIVELYDISKAGAICSDYIGRYKQDLNFKI